MGRYQTKHYRSGSVDVLNDIEAGGTIRSNKAIYANESIYTVNTQYSGDLNDIAWTCDVWAASKATNKPISTNGYCSTQFVNSSYAKQIYMPYGSYSNAVYTRQKVNGVWDSWVKANTIDWLWSGSVNIPSYNSGTKTNITLTRDASEYDYLIFTRGLYGSAISKRNNAGMNAGIVASGGGTEFMYVATLFATCSGKNVAIGGNALVTYNTGGGTSLSPSYTGIPLTEILGVKMR